MSYQQAQSLYMDEAFELNAYLNEHPPTHELVAAYLGYEPNADTSKMKFFGEDENALPPSDAGIIPHFTEAPKHIQEIVLDYKRTHANA